MKCYVDLHIHSCLSPCADEDMTPNNIVNMSLIKGLDIIAITDHNSARNAEALVETGRQAGLIVVPGMELCTSEEIHILCYFKDTEKLNMFQNFVYENLPPVKNREDIFGTQIKMDSFDQEIGREDMFLAAASGIDSSTAVEYVRSLGGVAVPAHVDRQSFSMLMTLGAIPEEYSFKYLEYTSNCNTDEFIKKHPELSQYGILKSSDAHFLANILEPIFCLDLPEKSIDGLFYFLRP